MPAGQVADRRWSDLDLLAVRQDEGRFTAPLVDWILGIVADLEELLAAGDQWWDPSWAKWEPPDASTRR